MFKDIHMSEKSSYNSGTDELKENKPGFVPCI